MQTDDVVLLTVFVAVALFAIWRVVRNRGVRGAILGGRVKETVGEVPGVHNALVSSSLTVHTIETGGAPDVALQFTMRTFLSWETVPLVMTRDQARELIRLLERATGSRSA